MGQTRHGFRALWQEFRFAQCRTLGVSGSEWGIVGNLTSLSGSLRRLWIINSAELVKERPTMRWPKMRDERLFMGRSQGAEKVRFGIIFL